jgi:glycosyltransferase involved in cell wall biosynthesis
MASPAISVVVPLYNKQAYIQRALASILGQTVQDIEVFVVNDGSTDEGPALVEQFRDARIRLITQENQGPGAARNRGLRDAAAPLVAFLDADDEWLPDYLESALAALGNHPNAAAVTSSYFDFPGGESTSPMWLRRRLTQGLHRVGASTTPQHLVHMLAFMTPCSTVARVQSLRRWGGFYERDKCRYGEDAWLWLKVLLNEPVFFDLTPRIRVFRDASGLSNIPAAHPLEPFLLHPEEIEQACPAHLRPLVGSFHSIRAFKTACVWSYWGRWREGRSLRNRFRKPGASRLPYYWLSLACATPLGAAAGGIARTARRSLTLNNERISDRNI